MKSWLWVIGWIFFWFLYRDIALAAIPHPVVQLQVDMWNQKVQGLNLSIKRGTNLNSPEVHSEIAYELLLFHQWMEGLIPSQRDRFRYLETAPTPNLRHQICGGISCGGSSSGSCGARC